MDANVSTMTMPKTMPVQKLLRYKHLKYDKEEILGIFEAHMILPKYLKDWIDIKKNPKLLQWMWCVILVALNNVVQSYLILKNSFSVKTDEMVLFHVKKATLLLCMWCVILVVN